MIRHAWLTLPSCFASSSTPTLLRMIFSSLVIVSSPRFDTQCLRSETTPPPSQPVRFDLNGYTLPQFHPTRVGIPPVDNWYDHPMTAQPFPHCPQVASSMLCRDCLELVAAAGGACPRCGSPRTL